MSRIFVFIPAGGTGSRFGAEYPKQYALLNDRTVLETTLDIFLGMPEIDGVYAGIADSDNRWAGLGFQHAKFVATTSAGGRRCDTVRIGLHEIRKTAVAKDWVLVHDACRPCVTRYDIRRLIATPDARQTDGAILAHQVADTLKRASSDDTIHATVSRRQIWQAQTPQLFRLDALEKALVAAHSRGHAVTDDSMAMEMMGHRIGLVHGDRGNIKITNSQDLQLARLILNSKPPDS